MKYKIPILSCFIIGLISLFNKSKAEKNNTNKCNKKHKNKNKENTSIYKDFESQKFNYLTLKLSKKLINNYQKSLSTSESTQFFQAPNKEKLNINHLNKELLTNLQSAFTIEPIKIKNYYDMQYYASLFVGSNKQEFSVIIDTGSNILWIPKANCTSCRNYTNKYDSSLSDTTNDLNHEINITYGKGYIEGKLFSDDIYITDKFGVKNMNFIVVDKELDLDGTISDGLLGLGIYFENNKNFSFIYGLYEQKLINKPAFTFYLTDSTFSNRLYIGDITENHYLNDYWNKMQSCQVNNSSEIYSKYWACDINSISTSNKSFVKTNLDFLEDSEKIKTQNFEVVNSNNTSKNYEFRTTSKAIFDTGSSLVFIPPNDFLSLIPFFSSRAVDKMCTLSYGFQIFCKCKSPRDFGSIFLNFEKGQFVIDFESIIDYMPSSDYQCRFQIILDLFNFDSWILGDSVLRYSFLTFDMQDRKISFLQNSGMIGDSKITGEIFPKEQTEQNRSDPILKYLLYFIIFCLVSLFAYSIYRCFLDKEDPEKAEYKRLSNN